MAKILLQINNLYYNRKHVESFYYSDSLLIAASVTAEPL